MQSWTFMDRDGWGEGPWASEPEDKITWEDSDTGLDCMMHRNPLGAWCGYVGVKKEHKYHRVDYMDIFSELDVHGGLTYAEECLGMGEDGSGVCHPANEGDHVWWLGFDCSHSFDAIPYLESSYRGSAYRTKDFVMKEVKKLAKQLA